MKITDTFNDSNFNNAKINQNLAWANKIRPIFSTTLVTIGENAPLPQNVKDTLCECYGVSLDMDGDIDFGSGGDPYLSFLQHQKPNLAFPKFMPPCAEELSHEELNLLIAKLYNDLYILGSAFERLITILPDSVLDNIVPYRV